MIFTFIDLAFVVTLAMLFSLIFSGAVYVFFYLCGSIRKNLKQWRQFWLVGLLSCGTSVLISIFTLSEQQYVSYQLNENSAFFSLPDPGVIISRFDWITIIIFLIYMLGLIINMVKLQFASKELTTIIKNSYLPENCLQRKINQWIKKFSPSLYSQKIQIRITDWVVSPFATNKFGPMIVLTQFSINQLSELQLRLILEHELSHLKNKDPSINRLSSILRTIYWFNPFFYLFDINLKQAAELNCDTQVLAHQKENSSLYTAALVKIMRETITNNSLILKNTNSFFSRFQKRNIQLRLLNISTLQLPIKSSFLKITLFLTSPFVIFLGVAIQPGLTSAHDGAAFQSFLREFRSIAVEGGIGTKTLNEVLGKLTLTRRKLMLETNDPQPSNNLVPMPGSISISQIENGRSLLQEKTLCLKILLTSIMCSLNIY